MNSVKFVDGGGTIHDSGLSLAGLNLLAHSQLIELNCGSLCGGHGRCGADRLILGEEDQKNVNAPNEVEKRHLSPTDIAGGVRLACQVFPNQDGLQITAKLAQSVVKF